MKTTANTVSQKHLLKEHVFTLLRCYRCNVLLLGINNNTIYVLTFGNKISSITLQCATLLKKVNFLSHSELKFRRAIITRLNKSRHMRRHACVTVCFFTTRSVVRPDHNLLSTKYFYMQRLGDKTRCRKKRKENPPL